MMQSLGQLERAAAQEFARIASARTLAVRLARANAAGLGLSGVAALCRLAAVRARAEAGRVDVAMSNSKNLILCAPPAQQ
jgi:hypothetical protein